MSGFGLKIAVGRLAGLTLALTAAAPAVGQTAAVNYPASRSLNDVAAWLQRDTPISLAQVVDVSPSAVTAVTSAAPMGETRGFRATVSSEAMDPEIFSHDGVVSWSIPVEVDCERRQVRLGAMTGYPNRDLKTEPRIVRPADTNWVNPTPTAPLGAVIRALCDREFQRPLMPRAKTAAASKPQASGPLPKIVVRPARPPKAEAAPAQAAATSTETPPDAKSASTAKAPPAEKTPRQASPPKTILIPGPAATAPAGAAPPAATPAEDTTPPPPKAKPKPIKTGSSPYVAQIGASPSLPDIQGQLDRFRKKFAADLQGLDAHVVTVQVEGKTVNRAQVSGFAGLSDADTFCKRMKDAGRPCLVRR
jgi:cell division protein FtsN